MINRIVAAAVAGLFAVGIAHAQASSSSAMGNNAPAATAMQPGSSTCESKAMDKNGKPLAGAAKSSFMKKCQASMKTSMKSDCESKAMDKNGKPLAGAAKTSFMKKCNHDACETKAVGSDGKKLAGAAKTSFMKKCEAGG